MKKILPSQTQARAIATPVVNPALRIIKAVLLTSVVALFWALSSSYVWANGDQIVGSWITPDDKAVVEIYQQDGQYFGKFVSLKEPTYAVGHADGLGGHIKVDRKNPNGTLDLRGYIGIPLFGRTQAWRPQL